jgi:hypothetical protein
VIAKDEAGRKAVAASISMDEISHNSKLEVDIMRNIINGGGGQLPVIGGGGQPTRIGGGGQPGTLTGRGGQTDTFLG